LHSTKRSRPAAFREAVNNRRLRLLRMTVLTGWTATKIFSPISLSCLLLDVRFYKSNYKMLQKFYTYRKCILTWTQILTLRAGDSRMALGQGLHSRMGGPSEDSHLFPFHSRMAPILTTRRTKPMWLPAKVASKSCLLAAFFHLLRFSALNYWVLTTF